MGFPRLGFLGGLLAAASLAILGSAASAKGLSAPEQVHLLDPTTDIISRRSSGRSYGTTPGGRAHKRWRTARASGRHNFRKTFRKAA